MCTVSWYVAGVTMEWNVSSDCIHEGEPTHWRCCVAGVLLVTRVCASQAPVLCVWYVSLRKTSVHL